MADLNVRITAQDKASPTIKAVSKELTNFGKGVGSVQSSLATFANSGLPAATAALSTFSAGAAQVAGKLTVLIGAGGIGGVTAAAVGLLPEMLKLTDAFIGWSTGLDSIASGYDNLDPKLKQHVDRLKEIQKQNELMGLTGVARAAKERDFIQQSIDDLERERKVRHEAVVENEKFLQQYALVPGFVEVFGGRLKEAREALLKVDQALEILRKQAEGADKSLGLETAEEGKKRLEEQRKGFEELTREAEKFRQKIEEINQEGARRIAMGKLPGPVELPLPAGVVTRDIAKDLAAEGEAGAKKWKDFMEDAGFDVMASQAKTMKNLTDTAVDSTEEAIKRFYQMQARAHEENRRQWEKTIDTIRDGAGRVFDAMLTKGESVFKSLANFAEGVLQTMLRNVFQNAVQALVTANAGLMKIFGGGGGGGGGGAGAIAGGSMALSGLVPFFSRGGGAGGYAQSGGITYLPTGGGKAATGFAGSAAGSAAIAGGAMAGQMLMMDAFRRGSAIEGMAGGALAGASIGTMIAPGVGTAIGAGVGAIAGLITGLFGGGAKRRAEEAAKRAAMIEAQKFEAPETISRFGIWGAPGEYAVETDLTGRIRGIGKQPTVNNYIEVQMIDAKHAREAGEVIANVVSERILTGGTLLSDNIQWAAS